jgi:hypothetical protein
VCVPDTIRQNVFAGGTWVTRILLLFHLLHRTPSWHCRFTRLQVHIRRNVHTYWLTGLSHVRTISVSCGMCAYQTLSGRMYSQEALGSPASSCYFISFTEPHHGIVGLPGYKCTYDVMYIRIGWRAFHMYVLSLYPVECVRTRHYPAECMRSGHLGYILVTTW